ncbi:MAG: hypothetical protein HZB51_30595 [Chloroflexi bacterium]|nr:hypothetical protein [Chloroflexota bacterium]
MNVHLVRKTRFTTWIVLFALVLVFATAGNPLGVSAASNLNASLSPAVPVANLLNADGTLNTKTGTSANLDLRGWNVTLDAKRGPIFSRAAKSGNASPATLPPQKPSAVPGVWTPMPFQGVNSSSAVRAIIQAPNPGVGMGNGIYIGGTFAGSGDFPPTFGNLGGIARYYNGVWWPLPNGGLGNGQGVYAIAVVGNYIYVGGSFTRTADSDPLYNGTLNNIALFNTLTNNWLPLPDNGLNGTVWALGVANGHLYVGGAFTASQNSAYTGLNGIARYDGGGTWTALAHNGLNAGATVYAIAANGNNVYVGGSFSQTNNGAVSNLNNIALYNDSSTSWSALANNGLSGSVYALAFSGANLYVGGQFSSALNPSVTLNNIAMYNGSWNQINDAGSIGLDGYVYALAINGTDIYAGGTFTHPNGGATTIARIGLWNGSTWSSLPNQGLNNTVYTIATIGLPALYNLYVGGTFDNVASGSVAGLGRIASVGNLCTSVASGNWSAGGTWGCGSAPANSDQVTIASGQTITIDADGIMIDGPLTVNGTIDATTHILTLGASAVVAGTGQIIGTVVRNTPGNGTQTYSDPNTQITFSNSSINAVTVTLTIGNPGGMTNSVGRKYTITPGTGTFTSANMRLPYKNSEFIGTIGNENNIKMWRFDSGQNRWVLQGGTADSANNWVDISGVTQFSPWTMSDNGTGSPTAVTVSSFSANANDSTTVGMIVGALLATVVMAGVWRLRKTRS